MAKNITGFLENLFEYYFLGLVMMTNSSIIWIIIIIVVNVNFFIVLKFGYYCDY